MAKCVCCDKVLNKSIKKEKNGVLYKSCPNCSSHNKSKHVYKKYPQEFGTTPLRSTPNNPEGPQSYCTRCRTGEIPNGDGELYCDDF